MSIIFYLFIIKVNLLQPLKSKLSDINIELHLVAKANTDTVKESMDGIVNLVKKGTSQKFKSNNK